MLNVKTKRYQLATKTFINIGLTTALKQYWWAFLVPVVMIIAGFVFHIAHWLVPIALVLTLLYVLFWYIQFYGITQLPQGKAFFEKYHYDISNQHLLMMKNAREGMPIKWEQIQRVERRPEAFVMWVSRGQFFYLPYDIFNSQNDIKWTETLLKRKKLLVE